MNKRGRITGTLLIGALLGLSMTGCQQSASFTSMVPAQYSMSRNPGSMAVQLLEPRRAPAHAPVMSQGQYPPAHSPVPQQSGTVVSLASPVMRVSHRASQQTVHTSHWRALPKGRQLPTTPLPGTELVSTSQGARPMPPLRQVPGNGLYRSHTAVDGGASKPLPMPTRQGTKSMAPIHAQPAGAPTMGHHHQPIFGGPEHVAPREGTKAALPPYVVEPPDILLVEISRKVPETEQPIGGQHLVRPDGTISLGVYGSVFVAGLTLDQARYAIFQTLRRTIKGTKDDPFEATEIYVDVLAYNSKVYYVITDGGGYGEQVYRIPATGNETVLDALSQINGLPAVASKKRIWLARSNAGKHQQPQVMPIDWRSITQHASPMTNYQIYPGDRIYVASDPKISVDTFIAKVLSPIERLLGITLLGSTVVNSISGRNVGGNNNR